MARLSALDVFDAHKIGFGGIIRKSCFESRSHHA